MNRKDEHVKLALSQHNTKSHNDFDQLHFVYNALTDLSIEDIDLSTSLHGITLKTPFYINAMTGGSEKTKEINMKLALVAQACDLAIASGSLSAALKDSSQEDSFKIIREINSEGLVFANIGAEYDLEAAEKAVSILNADLLQIHINVIQELVMPEGDRDFSIWKDNIKEIVNNLSVPVLVKEVGQGMSQETFKTLQSLNVKTIDVSGSGGTNFARIENARRKHEDYDFLLDFGLSTTKSLLEAYEFRDDLEIVASGGIRNPLDVVKALALGAKAVGVSAVILNSVMNEGVDETIEMVNAWKEQIKAIMLILNCKRIEDLKQTRLILSEPLRHYCNERQIDFSR